MQRYRIQHTDGKYFEMDFAGWSWQEDIKLARYFKDRTEANDCWKWLLESGEKCILVECTDNGEALGNAS